MGSVRIGFVQQVFGTEWARRSGACIRRLFPDSQLIQVRGTPPRWVTFTSDALRPLLRSIEKSPAPGATATPSPSVQPAATGSAAAVSPASPPAPQPPPSALGRLRRTLSPSSYPFDPLKAVLHGLEMPVDYLVHVDEDCFLQDAEQLREVIARMDADAQVICAGPSDGGTYFRHDRNPLACNLFFNVFKVAPLRKVLTDEPNWRALRVSDLPDAIRADLPAKGTPYRPLQFEEPFQIDDFEPYYNFYWAMLRAGYRIDFLPVRLTEEDDRRCTAIRLLGYEQDLCFHMWLMREWVAGKDLIINGVPNMRRYERAREVLAQMGVA